MTPRADEKYLEIIMNAVSVCAEYRPKFGQAGRTGLTLSGFQSLYEADPFYSWFGLSSPLLYAAHKAAGGMTSVYRQIGLGCQWAMVEILKDHLGISSQDAAWSYLVKSVGDGERKLMLDARISTSAVANADARKRVARWLEQAAGELGIPKDSRSGLQGAVFEIRQGYKSKDSKRQNADVANASNAYAHRYIPAVLLLSTQIDHDVAMRYARARWLLLRGTTEGTALNSTYTFMREVVGYDLADFFRRNSGSLREQIESVLRKLISEI